MGSVESTLSLSDHARLSKVYHEIALHVAQLKKRPRSQRVLDSERLTGWQVLHIGSTQGDPQFREFRLIAVLIAYPIAVLGLGTIGVRLYCWRRSMEQWLTLRTIAGLGVAAGMYIVTILGAAIILFIAALFFALPT